MKIGTKKLDLGQAIVLAAVIVGALVAAGLVLTWGPDDSRSAVLEAGTWLGGVIAAIWLALKGQLLTNHEDDDSGPDGGAALALLFAAAAASVAFGASGCGGVPHEARVGVEQLAEGVDRADELVEARVATRGEEARRTVLEETVAGVLTSVEAGLVRFDELLELEEAVVVALETARGALLTIEAAFDAWDAGASDAGFLAAAACGVVALAELADAFSAAGLELPDEITAGAAMLGSFAAGACPEPETSGGAVEVTS